MCLLVHCIVVPVLLVHHKLNVHCTLYPHSCCTQATDPHTHQYMERLKDEPLFLALCQKIAGYLTRIGDTKGLAKVALFQTERYYYKTEPVYAALRKMVQQSQQESASAAVVAAPAADDGDADEEEDEDEAAGAGEHLQAVSGLIQRKPAAALHRLILLGVVSFVKEFACPDVDKVFANVCGGELHAQTKQALPLHVCNCIA